MSSLLYLQGHVHRVVLDQIEHCCADGAGNGFCLRSLSGSWVVATAVDKPQHSTRLPRKDRFHHRAT